MANRRDEPPSRLSRSARARKSPPGGTAHGPAAPQRLLCGVRGLDALRAAIFGYRRRTAVRRGLFVADTGEFLAGRLGFTLPVPHAGIKAAGDQQLQMR